MKKYLTLGAKLSTLKPSSAFCLRFLQQVRNGAIPVVTPPSERAGDDLEAGFTENDALMGVIDMFPGWRHVSPGRMGYIGGAVRVLTIIEV